MGDGSVTTDEESWFDPPGLDTVGDDAPIVRYLTMTKFVDLVEQRRLYLPTLTQLRCNDELEGTPTRQRSQQMVEFGLNLKGGDRQQRYADELDRSQRTLPRIARVSCWNLAGREVRAMWEQYAPDGVAVFSSAGRLRRARRTSARLAFARVRYLDHHVDPMALGHYVQAAAKNVEFSWEREARLINIDRDAAGPLLVEVDLELLVQRVVTNPLGNRPGKTRVEELVKRAGLAPDLVEISTLRT